MARRRKGEGQTALITGASGGIGLDIADCFAKDGYDLILVARNADALAAQAHRLASQYNVKTTPIAIDLGETDAGKTLAGDIRARGLSVDVLVNNAGYGTAGAFKGSDRATQLGMIDLNVRALVELTHEFWPDFLAKRRGGVLNVASTASFQPGPLMAIYYASKAFVLSFSEALWREAKGTGVKVSCLCPGPTATGFRERAGTGKTRLSNMGPAVSSMSVAKAGYRAFQKNQRVIITGLRNRFLARLVPYLPRRTVLNLVYKMQSPK
ncbi:MAG: SDR family NAD(P)-dependent oxidoreductase [Alphaproteobacteria bacterium]|nr:SDR family NAD(P)-dependent oxidoreductase [Alphaproteobacteria bacterium]